MAAPLTSRRCRRLPRPLCGSVADLRFEDHPALAKAAKRGPVLALFVFDSALTRPAGPPRLAFLLRTLRSLDQRLRSLGASLTVLSGSPEEVVPELATRIGAAEVHVSADFGPYGSARDLRVAKALGAVPLVATGSPYAVSPPRLLTAAGTPYKVFTPFYRAWRQHGWPAPAASDPGVVDWMTSPGEALPGEPMLPSNMALPPAGEEAALDAWSAFQARELGGLRRPTRPTGSTRNLPPFRLPALRRAASPHAAVRARTRERTLHDRVGMA